jgi:hypothetical protein
MKVRLYGLREQRQFGKKLFLVGDSVPKPLGFTALPPEWLFFLGRLAPPRHSGRWVGARVASLRSPILRPGEVSISRFARRMMTHSKNSCRKRNR